MNSDHPIMKRPRISRWHDGDEDPPPAKQATKKETEPENHSSLQKEHRTNRQPIEPTTSLESIEPKSDSNDGTHRKPNSLKPISVREEGCRNSDLYENFGKIGEGTYGAVYKARCRETNELVALKRLKLESETEGFPITSIRETITLLKGKHPNVINVREIVFGNRLDQIYIVMDYMDRDLKSLMQDMSRPFKLEEVKLLMKQLISAIAHLHNNWILHRDLKTSNLLIHKGVLKVGDFGLAREYGSPLKLYTNNVVTLWYRAPELLLRQTGCYSTPIDVWSMGCIFGELFTKKPIFPGQSEIQQIDLIFKTLGSPTEELWPDFSRIRLVQKMKLPIYKYNRLLDLLGDAKILGNSGLALWTRLLAYDPGIKSDFNSEDVARKPRHRITAQEALRHQWFEEEPLPIHPSLFPTWPKEQPLGKK